MDFWHSVSGMVEVELTSADPDSSLRGISAQGIPLYRIEWISELKVRFWIRRKNLRALRGFVKKRGEELVLCRHRGLYWAIRSLVRRPVLGIGCTLFLCLVLFLPSRVLLVRVEGNRAIPTDHILEAAENAGIRFWSSRRQVRSEKMKNALLDAVPQLQWAGVNTYGCTAVISVREKSEETEDLEKSHVSSIVAAVDGVVSSCTATQGTLLCAVGEPVREGQVLISGYTDCGICIRAGQAEGEVYAQTYRRIRTISSLEYAQKTERKGTEKKYFLFFGKNRIKLWKGSGIWDATCGRMYEEYYITLPGGYALPFGMAVETVTYFDVTDAAETSSDLEQRLRSFSMDYLNAQMVAGRVLSEAVHFARGEDICWLEGSYLCTEMIGRVQREQIGEYYGKNS